MPVWIQMTAALSSALCSGLMGIALIPFLRKCRFCEPDPDAERIRIPIQFPETG